MKSLCTAGSEPPLDTSRITHCQFRITLSALRKVDRLMKHHLRLTLISYMVSEFRDR